MATTYSRKRFSAVVHEVLGPGGVRNPCVDVPAALVEKLKAEARKNQSIPVHAMVKGEGFKAHVVKYRGAWRLYLNGSFRKQAAVEVGHKVAVTLWVDGASRVLPVPPALSRALAKDKRAKAAFNVLPPYRRHEILRYLHNLKREETLKRVVAKTVRYLAGRETGKTLVVLSYRSEVKRRRR